MTTDRTNHVMELDRPDLPWADGYTVVVLGEGGQGFWRCLVIQGAANDSYEAGEVTSFSDRSLGKNFKRIA